jgi:hypothetical protein
MSRILSILKIFLLIPLFSLLLFGCAELKINYATVDLTQEKLLLHGINFDIGPLDVRIGWYVDCKRIRRQCFL